MVSGFYEALYFWCKIGVVNLRLPRGMCFLPVLVIMELNCEVIVLHVVSLMLVVSSEPKKFSVSSV